MSKTMTAAAAKTNFADMLREAEGGESVTITRYGKPVAVLVHPELARQLERLQSAGPQAGLAGLVGAFDDGEELVSTLDRQDSRRELPLLGE